MLCIVVFQFFFHSETFELVYAIAGALLFSAFIVFDTHMLMHKLSPEEYILASINLYLDMINLFIEILRILNSMKKNWKKLKCLLLGSRSLTVFTAIILAARQCVFLVEESIALQPEWWLQKGIV